MRVDEVLVRAADAIDDAARDARFSSRPPKLARGEQSVNGGHKRRYTEVGRRRLIVLTVLALVVVGAIGAYAVGGYLGEGMPGERWISTEEVAERVPELAADIPVPPGRNFTWRADSYAHLSGVIQESGVVETLAHDATCMWAREWLLAQAANDLDRANRAYAAILAARDWPYWTVINAEFYDNELIEVAANMEARSTERVESHLSLHCADYTTDP